MKTEVDSVIKAELPESLSIKSKTFFNMVFYPEINLTLILHTKLLIYRALS